MIQPEKYYLLFYQIGDNELAFSGTTATIFQNILSWRRGRKAQYLHDETWQEKKKLSIKGGIFPIFALQIMFECSQFLKFFGIPNPRCEGMCFASKTGNP